VKKSTFFLLLAGVFILSYCGGNQQQNTQQGGRPGGFGGFGGKRATSVEVKTLEATTVSKQVKAFGTVQSDSRVRIVPQVTNRITAFYVDLGDTVKVGQKLAKIYDKTFRDQVLRDQAQVQQARISFVRDSAAYARIKKLFDQNLSSDAEYQTAQATFQASKAQLASTQAALTQSQENLVNTDVLSPVAGVVVARNAQVGDVATTANPLFEIGNNSGYEIRLFLPLQDWELIRIGQAADLRITNQPNNTAKGVITRISPQLDPVTGLGEVVATIQQSTNSLYAGALTETKVTISTRSNTIVVPRSALIENVQTFIDPESNTIKLDRTYSVFITAGDTLAKQIPVELGLEQGDRVEILGAIKAGDKLIITGQNALEDNAAIKIAGKGPMRPQQGKQLAKGDSTAAKPPVSKAENTQKPAQRGNN
jgi:RND family efflux transporter MFP subunit